MVFGRLRASVVSRDLVGVDARVCDVDWVGCAVVRGVALADDVTGPACHVCHERDSPDVALDV